MSVFQIVLLCSCILLIDAMATPEVPQVKEVDKPRVFLSSWIGSSFNRPANYKDRYEELLKINEKLEKEYRDQLAQNERLRDKHEQELRDMNDRQQKEIEELKRKYEKEINDNVLRLETENSRLDKLLKEQVAATKEANEKYNKETRKNTELQGKIDNLKEENENLEKENNRLKSEAMNYDTMYHKEVTNNQENKSDHTEKLRKQTLKNMDLKNAKDKLLGAIWACTSASADGLKTTLVPCLKQISNDFSTFVVD